MLTQLGATSVKTGRAWVCCAIRAGPADPRKSTLTSAALRRVEHALLGHRHRSRSVPGAVMTGTCAPDQIVQGQDRGDSSGLRVDAVDGAERGRRAGISAGA